MLMLKRLWAIGLATTLAWATVVASQEPSKRPAASLSPEGGNRVQQVPFAEKGFTPLFDGKTLNGWTICCLSKDRALGVKAWTVDHGTILADTMGHKAHFYIWLTTNKEYGDFVLRPVIGHPNASHAWMLRQWLAKGIGMAGVDVGESHGSPQGRKVYTALWEMLTMRYGMSPKACLLPQSRGGLMLYNWAAENPSRVACIAGIYTVCDLRSYPGLEAACGAYGLRASELEARLAEHNASQ